MRLVTDVLVGGGTFNIGYSKNPHTRTCGLRTPRLKFGKKGAYI